MSSHLRSRNNTFANLQLERYAEQRDDTDWLQARLRSAESRFIVLREDGRILVTGDQRALRGLDAFERERLLGDAAASYLGSPDGSEHFLLRIHAAQADRD